jgi:hypothetical protein
LGGTSIYSRLVYVLGKIHPRLKGFNTGFITGTIQTKVLAYQTCDGTVLCEDASRSKETALQEAQVWDEFTSNLARTNPDMLPGNVRERAMKDQIPDGLLQYYEDPAQAMESYIFNMVSAAETIKLIGSRFVTNREGTQLDEASELGKLVQELRASGAIIDEQADRTIPEIMKLILSPKKGESRILQLARSFGYGTLLVEFTSTLSQLYDLPFVMLDNGFLPTFSAAFSSEQTQGFCLRDRHREDQPGVRGG